MQEGGQPGPTPTEVKPRRKYRYRSPFWGIVLVGIGAVLLLYNFDVISRANLAMLGLLWPILLVGIGVDLLVGRRSWTIGGLVGIVTVGLVVVLMLVGPDLGWAGDTDLKSETHTAPVGQATSARVSVDCSRYGIDVHALEPSSGPDRPLLVAHVEYQGDIDFEASGSAERTISLTAKDRRWWWGWLDLEETAPWDIGLDPDLPLYLSVDSSSGEGDLDLGELQLTGLDLHMGSGGMRVDLPAGTGQQYQVGLDMSSGDLEVQAADGAFVDMSVDMSSGDAEVTLGSDSDGTVTFDGSSGAFTLVLNEAQAVRIEVRDVSSGDVDLPPGLVEISKGDGEEGIWETEGYSGAPHKVLVVIENMSSGDFTTYLR